MSVEKEAWAQRLGRSIRTSELSEEIKDQKKRLEKAALSHLEQTISELKNLLQLLANNGDKMGVDRAQRLLRAAEALYFDIEAH